MPGYFFPAPPAFIGGRQPYGPRLGQPPGSPGDRQTRTYVTLAICIAAWAPATFNYLPAQTRIAPFLTPPGPPPPTSNAQLLSIIRQWDPKPVILPEPVEIASQIPAPVASTQPPANSAILLTLIRSWDPKPFVVPEPVEIASQITAPAAPAQQPGPNPAVLLTLVRSWDPKPFVLPEFVEIASQNSAPDVPPPRALSTPQVIGQAWTPATFWLPPQTRIAATLSTSAIPPPRVNATPSIIGLSWTTPSYLLPRAARVAALQPISVPPPRSLAPFAVIRAAWIQAPYALPELVNFAPLIPQPASSPPPPRSRALFEWIRRLWDPQPITPQRSPAPPRWTPILTGGPRYIVEQPATREFTVEQYERRAFAIEQPEPRLFTITSDATMGFRFDIKEPHELWPLTFKFARDLLPGETLSGSPSVSVAVVRGADSNPNGIFNGAAGLDATMTKVIVPVQAGVDQADYQFTVTVDTTTATKRLTLVGVLPVRSKFE